MYDWEVSDIVTLYSYNGYNTQTNDDVREVVTCTALTLASTSGNMTKNLLDTYVSSRYSIVYNNFSPRSCDMG